MAFKKIPPKVRLACGCGSSVTQVETVNADGFQRSVLSHKTFGDAYPDRLPSDNFTLDKQLKAGVKLTEVNSVVLSSDVNETSLPETDLKPDLEFETE